MAVARARDDKDEIRRIQDKMDLFQRQRDYEDAGLDVSAARLAAEKDIAEVKAAEAEFDAREVARAENALDQQLAEIRGDETMARVAADKAYLEERTAFWQGKGLTLLLAQQRAAEDLVQVDIARADAAAKLAQAQALDRDAELSRLRSATAACRDARGRAAAPVRTILSGRRRQGQRGRSAGAGGAGTGCRRTGAAAGAMAGHHSGRHARRAGR